MRLCMNHLIQLHLHFLTSKMGILFASSCSWSQIGICSRLPWSFHLTYQNSSLPESFPYFVFTALNHLLVYHITDLLISFIACFSPLRCKLHKDRKGRNLRRRSILGSSLMGILLESWVSCLQAAHGWLGHTGLQAPEEKETALTYSRPNPVLPEERFSCSFPSGSPIPFQCFHNV